MVKQKSFSKIEQELRRTYRNNLNIADSTEDVKKFFYYVVRELFARIFQGRLVPDFDDVRLDDQAQGKVAYSQKLLGNGEFHRALAGSDLARIMERFAEKGLNRIKHFQEKQPDKTEAKPFQAHSVSGRGFKNRAGC